MIRDFNLVTYSLLISIDKEDEKIVRSYSSIIFYFVFSLVSLLVNRVIYYYRSKSLSILNLIINVANLITICEDKDYNIVISY